jgi:ATP-grasp domain, R2K clade family 3
MLTVLLPSLPFQREIDPMWAAEAAAAQAQGYAVALFDAEQPKLYGPLPAQPVLYRGWMLTEPEYRWLEARCPLLVPYAQYAASHEARGWYDSIRDFTPPSRFLAVQPWLREWETGQVDAPQFVKGLVKSFGAESKVRSAADARQLVQRQELGPDELLFVRELVALSPAPEQRFFAVGAQVFGAGGTELPVELRPAVAALQTRPFYTIDVARTAEGQPTIIEVGDGQVSDVKEWTVTELYERVIRRLAEAQTT